VTTACLIQGIHISKSTVRSRRFADHDAMKEAVHDWLRNKPKTFFSDGKKELANRWAKCVQKKEDYTE
jgi:hypothetical protein